MTRQNDAPPPLDIRIVSQEWVPSTNPKYRYQLKAVVQTNTTIQPVAMVFECSEEIGQGWVYYAGETTMLFLKEGNRVLETNPKAYLALFESPPFRPEKPMIVMLLSHQPIKIVRFFQVPFR